jgi:hypothetical protein
MADNGEQGPEKREPMKVPISEKIVHAIQWTQRGFAGFFGKKTAGLSNRGKIIFLMAVCFVFGGLSLFSFVDVFNPSRDNTLVKPGQVAVPKHFDKTGELPDDQVVIVSPAFYKRLQDFKLYMDSLRKNSKVKYDSIVRARPGLLDSVLFLEQIYSEQKR